MFKNIIILFCLAAAALSAPFSLLADSPNIIIVLSDDQGYGDFSINGNPVIKTPNIDALGNRGFRFTDFHVAPMCTPTRGQLMTGLDAMRNGAINVSSGRSLPDSSLKTMADVFKDAGYATGLFGKWHLGDNYPYRPEDRGFDEAIWFPSSHLNSVADYWDNDYFDDFYKHNGRRERFNGYCTDVFFNEAIDWMKKKVEASEPFFTYLPLNAAHWPPYVPDEYRGPARKALEANSEVLNRLSKEKMNPYYGNDIKEAMVTFLAMGLNIDENMGKLMGFLKDDGLMDNTIILFFTDNGSSFGRHYYNAGMRGGKQELFEGGHRVPLFINGPESILGKPAVIEELCHVQDLLPTLASAVGVEKLPHPVDGIDLLPLMKGDKDHLEDRMLVINFTKTGQKVLFPEQDNPDNAAVPKKDSAAVLWKNWRFLDNMTLYDVSKDPHQDTNVAKEHPEIVEAMRTHLSIWWDDVKDDANKIHRIVIGAPQENPMMLTACDWYNIFVDMQKQVRKGDKKSGYWHVIVDHPGTYDFELRRWPVESGYGLNDSISETKVTDGILPAGVAFPIASARLLIGDQEQTLKVSKNDKSARFTFELDAGETSILTTFYDENGERISGAYYLYVHRRSEGSKSKAPTGGPRANAPVFKKLYKGINIDTTGPVNAVWPKIQHDAVQFKAVANAGFESVRVFLPFKADHEFTEQQIKDALSNDLAIVVCMWGSQSWSQNPKQGVQEIANRWGQLAELWKDYPSDLVFEILNEPEGVGFMKAKGAPKVMPLYNAAVQAIRDVDPDRPILIGSPGYNDSELLNPFVTEEYLTYQFDGGKGFYDDTNTGVAIHFYSPKHQDGLNFAMWTQPLWGDESRWKDPITEQIMNAVNWKKRIGVDIPIITTEWGCWLFPKRTDEDLNKWLDHHVELFDANNIGNMWYTGIQNNQRAFGIYDSELGWNQTVLGKLTGVKPTVLPKISQVINGEFNRPDHAWQLTSDKITREYIFWKKAFSGNSMLKLTVPDDTEGQLFLQTYKGESGYAGAPGRTLLHLINGRTYRMSFIAASEDGEGRVKIVLKDAKSMATIYDSYEADGGWINISKEPRTYTRLYTHNADSEMDVRLEFDVGSRQQILYLDKVELIRH